MNDTQFDIYGIYFIPDEYFLLHHIYPFRAVAKINLRSFDKQNITMQRNRPYTKTTPLYTYIQKSLYVHKMYIMNCADCQIKQSSCSLIQNTHNELAVNVVMLSYINLDINLGKKYSNLSSFNNRCVRWFHFNKLNSSMSIE